MSAKEGHIMKDTDSKRVFHFVSYLLKRLWSAFTVETVNVQCRSLAFLNKSLSVSNVRHNSARYPKVSNA